MTQTLNIMDWLLLFGWLALLGIFGEIYAKSMKHDTVESQDCLFTRPTIFYYSGLLLGTGMLYLGVPGTFPYGPVMAVTHPLNIYSCVIGSLLVLISFRTSWLSVIRPFLTSTLSSFPWKLP